MKNHLKITILTSPSGWGGMEVHTLELARTLKAKGHDVSIIEVGNNLYSQRCSDQEGVGLICLPTAKKLRERGLLGYLSILCKLRGDVLIFPKGGFCEGNWYFDLLVRLKFPRYITIEHLTFQPMPPKCSGRYMGGLLPGLGLWWYRARLNYYLRSLWPHCVVCISDAVAKVLIDHHRFSPKKVHIIHNGIDSDKFQPQADYRAALRNILGIPQNTLVFGAIGRLHPVKGFGLALELFRKLISSSPDCDVRFVLVGDGPEREAFRQLAEEPDIKEKVKLIGFTDKPWEIYPAFDVFVMPSQNEGLPLSLLEAMACGCCPVAMGVGGIPEVIIDPSLGWLVQPNDRPGFFEAMKRATEIDPEKLREMGRKAREHIVLNFEARKQFLTTANLIENEFGDKFQHKRLNGESPRV